MEVRKKVTSKSLADTKFEIQTENPHSTSGSEKQS